MAWTRRRRHRADAVTGAECDLQASVSILRACLATTRGAATGGACQRSARRTLDREARPGYGTETRPGPITKLKSGPAPYFFSGSANTYSAWPVVGGRTSGISVFGTRRGLPPPRPVVTATY